jgi:hypothetical protein
MGGDTSDDKMTGRIARERNHFPLWAALFLIFGIHVPKCSGVWLSRVGIRWTAISAIGMKK